MTSSESLVQEMRSKGHLPALEANVGAICTLTDDPQVCLADLTAVILRDCSLTSNLIAAANSALYGRSERINTVSVAINTLGFEFVRSLALGLGIVRQISDHAQERNLYRLFASAYFSGMLAMSLGKRLHNEESEQLFVTGLLSGLPRLLLAHAFPDRYAAMEAKVISGRVDLNQACLDAFGARYADLAGDIARFWNVPPGVVRVLTATNRNDRTAALVHEAGQIADLMFGNLRGGAEALAPVETKLRSLLRDPEFQVADFVAQTCEEDPNAVRFFKLTRQDVEMIVRIAQWGKVSPAEVSNLLSSSAGQRASPAEVKEDPALIIGQILTDLVVGLGRGAEINEILLTAMEGICRCLRPACVMAAFPGNSGRLEGRLCLGISERVQAAEFQAPLDDPSSILVKAFNLKKPVAGLVSKDLPLPFLRRLNLERLWLVPIVALGKSIGLCLVAREALVPFTRQEEIWSTAIVGHVSIAFERTKSARPSPGR